MKTNEWLPANEVENFDTTRHHFEWNTDYSMFRATRLAWHDTASYIAYQAAD